MTSVFWTGLLIVLQMVFDSHDLVRRQQTTSRIVSYPQALKVKLMSANNHATDQHATRAALT